MAHLELKFDAPPIVSTRLAEEYILAYNDEFKNVTHTAPEVLRFDLIPPELDIILAKRKLAKSIEKNAELFCQLEYMLRNRTIEEVKNIDLKLIENTLLDSAEPRVCTNNHVLNMGDDTPLAFLGFFSYAYPHFHVYCTEIAVPVCFLFKQLCADVGLKVDIVRSGSPLKSDFNTFCTGIITEKSDIDSAADAFLVSTSQKPWRLQRILVQENVYQTFKKCIEYKSKLKEQENVQVSEDVKKLSSELYVYKDKVFIFDFVGDKAVVDSGSRNIYVEAYRTTKEVLTLIQNAILLSLWSNDISEAHEIALQAPSVLIWVNDFGNMNGPPMTARWLYKQANILDLSINQSEIKKRLNSWTRFDGSKQRINIMWKALEKYKNEQDSDNEIVTLVEKILVSFRENKFFEIDNGRMYMTLGLPVGIIPIAINYLDDVQKMIKSLLIGNGHIVSINEDFPQVKLLIEVLEDSGAPVTINTIGDQVQGSSYIKYKTIISEFGTIFAN